MELGRQHSEPAILADSLRRIATGQITPPLMPAFRLRMNALEARHTDDSAAPGAAILKPHNLYPPDTRVLDDENKIPAGSLAGALGPDTALDPDPASSWELGTSPC